MDSMDSTTKKPLHDLTTGEAARLLRCSQQTVIRACDKGFIPFYKLPGSRFRRIRKQDLMRFMEEAGIPLPPNELNGRPPVAEAACNVEVNQP